MQRVHDRVQETGTATSGNITLTGAVSGFASFSSRFTLGEPIYFACVDGTTWGVYRGHLLNSTTLVIDSLYESSSTTGTPPDNVFNNVTFSGASMNVFATIPAEEIEEVLTKGQSYAVSVGMANYLG
jgi:hypothetical protein